MENQGKQLLLAVGSAFAIMLLWSYLFPPEKPEQAKPAAENAAATTPAPAAGKPGAAGTTGTTPAATAAAPRGPEQLITLDSPQVRATFSSWGGALKSWKLMGEQFHEPGSPTVPDDMV